MRRSPSPGGAGGGEFCGRVLCGYQPRTVDLSRAPRYLHRQGSGDLDPNRQAATGNEVSGPST